MDFLLALQFLTVLPVKIANVKEKRLANALIYFPLAGLLLGLILAGIDNLLNILHFAPLAVNTILVVALASLTGGLHLDGLADTIDAFLSRKNKEEMLKIMRDAHIGAMGVISLICIILLKIALLNSVGISLKTVTLLLMCTLSRWSLVWAIYLFPCARQDGKAKVFIQGINSRIFIFSTIIASGCALMIWQLKGLFIIVIVATGIYAIGKFINNKIGGITGDTLGAINELSEVIILFSICVIERSSLCII